MPRTYTVKVKIHTRMVDVKPDYNPVRAAGGVRHWYLLKPEIREWIADQGMRFELRSDRYQGFLVCFSHSDDALAFKMRWL